MKLSANYKDNILTIQPREYIEGGWYIEHHDSKSVPWYVYVIPLHGGKPELITKATSFKLAIEWALELK